MKIKNKSHHRPLPVLNWGWVLRGKKADRVQVLCGKTAEGPWLSNRIARVPKYLLWYTERKQKRKTEFSQKKKGPL